MLQSILCYLLALQWKNPKNEPSLSARQGRVSPKWLVRWATPCSSALYLQCARCERAKGQHQQQQQKDLRQSACYCYYLQQLTAHCFCSAFITRYHSPAWPDQLHQLGRLERQGNQLATEACSKQLTQPVHKWILPKHTARGTPSTFTNTISMFGKVPGVKCLFTAGRKSYLWFRH